MQPTLLTLFSGGGLAELTADEKRCSRCANVKPLTAFNLNRSTKDGSHPYCRECFTAYSKALRERKAEHFRQYDRDRRKANPEVFRERDRARRAANPDIYRERDNQRRLNPERRDYSLRLLRNYRDRYNANRQAKRAANPESENAKKRAWRAANVERERENQRRWKDANPEKVRIFYFNKQAKRRAAPGQVTRDEWATLKAHYEFRCLCCGKSEPEIKLTRDHVVPVSCGGWNIISNIQPLCLPCNSAKHTKSTDYRP